MLARIKAGLSRIEADDVAPFSQALGRIRHEIDQIDTEMIALIAKRATLTKRAFALKSKHGMPLHCPQREQEILERLKALAIGYGIDPLVVEGVFMLLLRQYAGPDSGSAADPVSQYE
ncbi:MAG TPA: chorismate mutase [Gammaproteobacteria bacterium]|nr:chorismate mutase [Gammaproteobacteria bacterium]